MAKGSKTCSNCKAEVAGPRTKVCPACSAPFEFNTGNTVQVIGDDGQPVLIDTTRTVFSYPDGYIFPDGKAIQNVHIPAGTCPIKLLPAEGEEFPSDNTLLEWAGDVRQEMLNKGLYLRNKALTYWARRELSAVADFAPRGDEMVYVGMVINEMPDIVTREIPT